ncbi:hypothetical protein MXD62_36580 [Frankia sp. Mgl5]|uniref:hypothetical protein n=1 Tax=Frankia sp. Mgl5 TaxID=2933793 RepID=UPI00200FB665|nr:hypothetical protein [Frankia sp. Mgl5]MCK9932596.1 hypothetical protein [Frankia sp. Mgl5]
MKAVLTGLACVFAVIVVFVVVRGQIDSGSNFGSGSGSGGLGGGPNGPGPVERPSIPTSATPDSTGTPTVTQRGTSGTARVDCSSIDSELKISAFDGAIRWNAASASGVSVSPSSGFLDEGESEVVRIAGSYTGGGGFDVVVSAPNRSGSGSVNYPFTCA